MLGQVAETLGVLTPAVNINAFVEEVVRCQVTVTNNRLQAASGQGKAVASGVIISPVDNEEVRQAIIVRGTIHSLDLDFRAWLVVKTPVGDHYPQRRVTRSKANWEGETRIGLARFGSDEGAVYDINLVAAGPDADYQFERYVRGEGVSRDGYGPILPADATILDCKRVVRRDLTASAINEQNVSK